MIISELNYTREPTPNEIYIFTDKIKFQSAIQSLVNYIRIAVVATVLIILSKFVSRTILTILVTITAIYLAYLIYTKMCWLKYLHTIKQGKFEVAECFITNIKQEGSYYIAKIKLNDKQVIKEKFEVSERFYKDWKENPKMLCFLAGTKKYKTLLLRNDGRSSY